MADPTPERSSRRTRILTALIVVGCLLGAGAALGMNPAADWYARKYLREHYGWLHPSTVRFHYPFQYIELGVVSFDKGWVRGNLTSVVVHRESRAVKVTGGEVEADLDRRTSGTGDGERPNVTVEGLTLVTVTRGKVTAMAHNVGWDGKVVTFKGVGLETPWGRYDAAEGSYVPKVRLVLSKAGGRIPVPVKIPGLDLPEVTLMAEGVTIHEQERAITIQKLDVFQPAAPEHIELVSVGELEVTSVLLVKAAWVQFKHPWVSSKPERIMHIRGQVRTTPHLSLKLFEPLQIEVLPEDPWISARGTCQEWADVVAGDTILQTIAFTGELHVEVGLKPIPSLKMDRTGFPATCAPVSCATFRELRRPFKYTAIRADGTPFERTAGPGTLEWIPLGSAGKMPLAVENLEDPGFASHRGFIRQAYENSLIENVRTGKFTRGGSTLTMQLAKNLYLLRNKTLLRKAQELLLAMAMEKCLTKSEIIELYLNVVEFGPNVYGIGPGARHWFKKTPEALEPIEAFWMASILPRPRKTPPPGDMKGTERLMENLAKMGKIPGFTGGTGDLDTSGWE